MSGCVIRCERLRDSLRTGEKKLGAEKNIWGVEKVIWPPNTITKRHREKKQKQKKTRFFRLGAEKYDFRALKGRSTRTQNEVKWRSNVK